MWEKLFIFVGLNFFMIKKNKPLSIIIGTSSDTWGLMPVEYKQQYKDYLIEKYQCKCKHCEKDFEQMLLEIDHIIPISMGGPVCRVGNMQLLCRKCHKKKTENVDNNLVEERILFRESKKRMYSC